MKAVAEPPKSSIEFLGPIADERPDIIARYLASIIDSSDDAILGKDLNGIIKSWNASAARHRQSGERV